MLTILFVILFAVCNAIMDVLQFRYSTSVFKSMSAAYWDPKLSWKNKWKNGNSNEGENFIGSSTIFVFMTDAWHLAKSLMLLFICLAIVFYSPMFGLIIDFLIIRVLIGLTFELFWRIL